MSVENCKVCCNCKHCIREWDADGHCDLHCEIDGHYIGYVECHEGWCKHWCKERRADGVDC